MMIQPYSPPLLLLMWNPLDELLGVRVYAHLSVVLSSIPQNAQSTHRQHSQVKQQH